jgi:hypothetical protein
MNTILQTLTEAIRIATFQAFRPGLFDGRERFGDHEPRARHRHGHRADRRDFA